MHKKFLSCLFVFSNLLLYSQIGGKSTYQFLNLVTSPRQAALGGKVITLYDNDVNQAQFNPATINPEMDNKLALNYGSYYGEVTYGTAAYAYTYDRHVQTFHAGINYVNYLSALLCMFNASTVFLSNNHSANGLTLFLIRSVKSTLNSLGNNIRPNIF